MPAQVRIIATGGNAAADNFSAIVDVVDLHELQSCVWRNGGVQIDDRAVDPDDRVTGAEIAGEGLPNDLTAGVDGICLAEAVAIQRSEIDGLAISPKRCMERCVAWGIRTADCFPCIIQPDCR